MPLPAEEIKRRIEAARILRNISQVELQRQLAADGLGKTEAGRIERGELPLTKIRRVALAEALGVPESWFLVESVDHLLMPPAADDLLEAISRLSDSLDRAMVEQAARVVEVLTRLDAIEETIQASPRRRQA